MGEGNEIPVVANRSNIESKNTDLTQLVGEERLTSNNEVARAIHATNRQIADTILASGLMIDSRMGFAGVAIRLGRNKAESLNEIENTHRGLPVVVFMTYPNIHREVVSLKESGKLSRDFAEETVFSQGKIAQEDPSGYQKTDTYFDSELIEGYYDKDSGEWVDNPNYWERKVDQETKQGNLDSEQSGTRKIERFEAIRQKTRERLQAVSEKYLEELHAEPKEWWKDLTQDGEVKIP